jgi:Ca-activated chloride channel homolog
VKSRLNEELLRDIALEDQWRLRAWPRDRNSASIRCSTSTSPMERREVDSGLQRRYEERFQLPLLVALVLLLVETALGDRKRAPLPARGRAWLGSVGRRLRLRGTGTALVALAFVAAPDGAARDSSIAGAIPSTRASSSSSRANTRKPCSRFGEALVESPASPLLQFDLAAALYKQGRYAEAIASLEKVAGEGGEEWRGRANYNLGNAHFRAGVATEEDDPQQTLERWGQALLAYRRAMAADPSLEDAKFNHELVEHRIEELRRRLEEQQQEQENQEEEQGQEGEEPQQQDQEERQQDQEEQRQGDEEQQPNDQPGEARSSSPSTSRRARTATAAGRRAATA